MTISTGSFINYENLIYNKKNTKIKIIKLKLLHQGLYILDLLKIFILFRILWVVYLNVIHANLCEGVSNLLASLHYPGRRVVMGHTLNTLWHVITKEKSHDIISEFMILWWATFTASLGCVWPTGCRLDTPGAFKLVSGGSCSEKWWKRKNTVLPQVSV